MEPPLHAGTVRGWCMEEKLRGKYQDPSANESQGNARFLNVEFAF